jgi:hypothetical protein
MLASSLLKVVAVYLSPSRPIMGSDLPACFGGGLLVLMGGGGEGGLNAKHVDWNSRLTTTGGKILRDYASGNTCLIYGMDSPITLPYNFSATTQCPTHRNYQESNLPSLSDGVLSTKLKSPACTDGHNVPIILSEPASPTWLQGDRLGQIEGQPWREATVHPVTAERGGNRHCVEEMSTAISEALAASTPKSRPPMTHDFQYRHVFRIKYAWRTGWGGSGKSPGTLLWKLKSTVLRGLWLTS